jgi:hypothetical protein
VAFAEDAPVWVAIPAHLAQHHALGVLEAHSDALGVIPLFGPLVFEPTGMLAEFVDSSRGSGSDEEVDARAAAFTAGAPCDSDSGLSFGQTDEQRAESSPFGPTVQASRRSQQLDAMWTAALPEAEITLPKIAHDPAFSLTAGLPSLSQPHQGQQHAAHHHGHHAQGYYHSSIHAHGVIGDRTDIGKTLLHGKVDFDSLPLLDGAHEPRTSVPVMFHPGDKGAAPAQRTAHNAMERERRVNLRKCFESLRLTIPGLRDSKAASLQVLNEACKFIQDLHKEEVALLAAKAALAQEQQQLRAAILAKQQQQQQQQGGASAGPMAH